MKKLSLLALILMMSLTLAACGGTEEADSVVETETETEVTVTVDSLIAKHTELVDVVNTASLTGEENGWAASEEFDNELRAALALLELTKADLEDPSILTEEYMLEMDASFDEMIPAWQDYLLTVSEPYAAE